ncbi:hypothetical protein JYT28_00165 [Desulfobulbus sp. AH-315-M07]|nr:hypothetical protein [Desulfobulbus sp. AH-315-M07]
MIEMNWRIGMFAVAVASAGMLGCSDQIDIEDSDNDGDSQVSTPAVPAPTTTFSCTYPVGSFGVAAGQIAPSSIQFSQGFLRNETEPGTLAVPEMFDCDGSNKDHAVAIITGQYL